MTHNTIEVNCIDGLPRKENGTIIMAHNTTYVIENPIVIKYLFALKRKRKRFNTRRYQVVVFSPN